MGRHAGWIALHCGLAAGANIILIPERPFDIEKVVAQVESRFATHYAPIIVVAEGALPAEGTMATVDGERDAFGHVRLRGSTGARPSWSAAPTPPRGPRPEPGGRPAFPSR